MIPLTVLVRNSQFIVQICSTDQTIRWLTEYVAQKYPYCRITDVRNDVNGLRLMPSTKILDLMEWNPNLLPRVYLLLQGEQQPQHQSLDEWTSYTLLHRAENIKFSTMTQLHIELTENELRELAVPSLFEDKQNDPFIFLNTKKINKAFIVPSFDPTQYIELTAKNEWQSIWKCDIICSTEELFTYKVAIKFKKIKPRFQWKSNQNANDNASSNSYCSVHSNPSTSTCTSTLSKTQRNKSGKMEIVSSHRIPGDDTNDNIDEMKYNFVEIKQEQNGHVKQQLESIWNGHMRLFLNGLVDDWNIIHDKDEDDMAVLEQLKEQTLENHIILFTIFRHLCSRTGDAKWLNQNAFRYFIEHCNVTPGTVDDAHYPQIIASILSNIWTVINIRNQSVHKLKVSPRRESVIKEGEFMSFEEFLEAVCRLAFVSRIDATTKTVRAPTMAAISSPRHRSHTAMNTALLTPPECLEFIINSFCQRLIPLRILELEELLTNTNLNQLIAANQESLDRVFKRYSEAVQGDEEIDNQTIDLNEFNLLMTDVVESKVIAVIQNDEFMRRRVNDRTIVSVSDLKQIFYSSQRLNLSIPNGRRAKIDKKDHLLDIHEFYEAVIRSGFKVFHNMSTIKNMEKHVPIANDIMQRVALFVQWLSEM